MPKTTKPDSRAARAAARTKRERTTKPAVSEKSAALPRTPEDWRAFASAKAAEIAARPPVREQPRDRTAESWAALADMIARDFRR